jgi:hypothetical protein
MTFIIFWNAEHRAYVGVFPTNLRKVSNFPRYKDLLERWKITLA